MTREQPHPHEWWCCEDCVHDGQDCPVPEPKTKEELKLLQSILKITGCRHQKNGRNNRSSAGEPAPNLHTCEHKEIRNDVEFCYFHDAPTKAHDERIRSEAAKTERAKVLDEVLEIINKNCYELEGKRLKIAPLLLCKEIESLRQRHRR